MLSHVGKSTLSYISEYRSDPSLIPVRSQDSQELDQTQNGEPLDKDSPKLLERFVITIQAMP
jgi:hypothetical protein